MYNTIYNPITKANVGTHSDLGKRTLVNFINYFQNGGKPCTNCGRGRHNRRTCNASGAKYWRKLPKKERNRLIRNIKNTKKFTRGYISKNTVKNHIDSGEIKENRFSINKETDFYFFEKNKLPDHQKVLFKDVYKNVLHVFIKKIDTNGKVTYQTSYIVDENLKNKVRIPSNIEVHGDEYIIKNLIDFKKLFQRLLTKRHTKRLFEEIGSIDTKDTHISLVFKYKAIIDWEIGDLMKKDFTIDKSYAKMNFIKLQQYIAFIVDKSEPDNHRVIGVVEAYNVYNEFISKSETGLNITEDNRHEWFKSPQKKLELSTLIAKKSYAEYNINDFRDEIPNKPLYYISTVSVHPDYRGKKYLFNDKGNEFIGGICKPLVGHMVSELKKLYPKYKLLIDNVSDTKDGIPACYCYYAAGIDNGYNMKYQNGSKTDKFVDMPAGWCSKCGPLPDKDYICQGKYLYDLE